MPKGTDVFYEPSSGVKRRVYRSEIWEHFTSYWIRSVKKVKNDQTNTIEDVVDFKERAKCKYCPKNHGDFAADSGPNGTRGLVKHIPKRCKWYPSNTDLTKQKVLGWEKGDFNQLVARGFDQKETKIACVEMVVIDVLPFSFVEKKGFRKFCKIGMPVFIVPSRRSLVRNFLEIYEGKKNKKLRRELGSHRISLTTNTWTSLQNINYVVITAHFIDSNWKMHKRVLNFCVIPNHQGFTIAHILEECLSECGIKKILTITVDNASSNKIALDLLAKKLNDWDDPAVVLRGKYIHVRCVAHITNLVAGNGLKMLNSSILAIRNAVRFVRSSPNRLEYFKKVVAREKLHFKGICCLDVPTRWNSTYMMLDCALKFKKAFRRMEHDQESTYTANFKEPEEAFDDEGNSIVQKKGKKVGPPCERDWDVCGTFVGFLKTFYEVTLRVSASLHPTIHTTFHDIVNMEETMNKNYVGLGIDSTENDRLMAAVSSMMKTKYCKYFGKLNELNPLIILGLVLDPRFKLNYVKEILLEDLHWRESDVIEKEAEIKQLLFDLYEKYVEKIATGKRKIGGVLETNNIKQKKQKLKEGGSGIGSSGMKYVMRWTKRMVEAADSVVEHEIDKYLKDKVLSFSGIGRNYGESKAEDLAEASAEELAVNYMSFDLLHWWKMNGSQYPVLTIIAKDIFCVQVSTIASESAFSTSGRVIDAFRSSLTPQSVETLICMQNWLRGDDIIIGFEEEPCLEELEFYEDIEEELRATNTKGPSSSSNSNAAISGIGDKE